MKVFISMIILCSASVAFSQVYVDDVNINQKEGITFILVTVAQRGGGPNRKTVVIVDYGQKMEMGKEQVIAGADKQPKAFEGSAVEVLNFFVTSGWELEEVMAGGGGPGPYGGGAGQQYLLKRK